MRRWILFLDESGFSQRPSVRRTWAPRGQTPVLTHAFNWKKMSIVAVLAFRWDGRRDRLYFEMTPGSYNAESLEPFIVNVKREMGRRKCILLWDGLPAHKSKRMQDFLEEQKRWLAVERLPSYAPDLNPVESIWGNVKGQELANFCAEKLDDAALAFGYGMERIRKHHGLAQSFLQHSGLFI